MAERIAGVTISHPGRVIFADSDAGSGPDRTGLTKAGLARYYNRIAPLLLDEAANRPLSLLRLPQGMAGERFFQKHPGKGFPRAIRQMRITESDGEDAPYAYVTDAAGLVSAVQMGTVEFHIWAARRDRLERPDRLVLDLDPDEGLGFDAVRRAALSLRGRLLDLGLSPWALLTGGKGVHLVVPLRRSIGWGDLKRFAHGFAALCARDEPDRYTVELAKASRKGRIFIDWLRNERGSTAIAPFSVRARPGAPVAAPVGWDELAGIETARAFGIAAAQERGWAGVARKPQSLTRAMFEALETALAG